jgi:hypothetical protein
LLWACLVAALFGLAIGLRFRLPMLLLASGLWTCAIIAVAVASGWSFSRTIVVLLLLLFVQQCSYLIGLLASTRRFQLRDRGPGRGRNTSNRS